MRLFCGLAIGAALVLAAPPVLAGECDYLARLAQQSASYYRNSGGQHHRAAARNYQNSYNACVNSVRRRTAPAARRGSGGVGTMFDPLVDALGIFNSLQNDSAGNRARSRANQQRVREQEERQRAIVRRNEEDIRRRMKAAAEQRRRQEAERRRQEAEWERQRAAAEALRKRCLEKNPFGGGAASACGKKQTASATNPFAKKPGSENPFARVNNPDFTARNEPREKPIFDSVNGVECPVLFVSGCVPDGVWEMMRRIKQNDGDIIKTLRAAQLAAGGTDPYEYVITQEQYERLGCGEVTYEEILSVRPGTL